MKKEQQSPPIVYVYRVRKIDAVLFGIGLKYYKNVYYLYASFIFAGSFKLRLQISCITTSEYK